MNVNVRYHVECRYGHVYEAPRGSELESRCIQRIEQGYIDAYPVASEDCPYCREEQQTSSEQAAQTCDVVGCAMAGLDDYSVDDNHGEGECVNGSMSKDCIAKGCFFLRKDLQ